MRRRQRAEEDDNAERWVVSYADFITLLFAFFTALYAISQVDSGKLEKFTGSMRSAFKSGESELSKPVIEGITPVSPDMIVLEKEFRSAIETLKINEGIDVRRNESGVIISLGDTMFFDAGQAVIRDNAVTALTAIASILQKTQKKIIIEGHTDNVPIGIGARYSSNWELSTARATSVLNYMIKNQNISPDRLSASGYAEFRPVAANSTPEGRAKNRRVDIVVLDKKR